MKAAKISITWAWPASTTIIYNNPVVDDATFDVKLWIRSCSMSYQDQGS
jgi:hypothetical protein